MEWKIVKNENDLPQKDELVLIYTKLNSSGEEKYHQPEKWNPNSFLGNTLLIFKIYKVFAYCKSKPIESELQSNELPWFPTRGKFPYGA